MARLAQAEAHEPDVWLRDDLRQAFITVSLAAKGSDIPFIEASYRCYGVHPDKLFSYITAKRRAQLGDEYDQWYDAAGNRRIDVPKKPSLPAQTLTPTAAEKERG